MKIIPHSALRKIIKKFGSEGGEANAKIYFGRLCSCIGKAGGNYDPTCPYCIFGFIYEEEPVEELVLRTAVNLRFMTDRQISIYQGGCRITLPRYRYDGITLTKSYDRIAQGDIIVMTGDVHRDRDILKRNEKDYLYAFDVTKVLSVSELDYVFKEGVHYTVNYTSKKTSIVWNNDPDLEHQPPSGYYSVDFECKINYMVWEDMPKPRGAMDSNSEKMIMCRLRPYFDPNANKVMSVNTDFDHNVIGEDND